MRDEAHLEGPKIQKSKRGKEDEQGTRQPRASEKLRLRSSTSGSSVLDLAALNELKEAVEELRRTGKPLSIIRAR